MKKKEAIRRCYLLFVIDSIERLAIVNGESTRLRRPHTPAIIVFIVLYDGTAVRYRRTHFFVLCICVCVGTCPSGLIWSYLVFSVTGVLVLARHAGGSYSYSCVVVPPPRRASGRYRVALAVVDMFMPDRVSEHDVQ